MKLGMWVVIAALTLGACASAENGGAPAGKPNKEVSAGGASIRGGGIRMDVQVGRAQPKKSVKNGTVEIKPHATVTP